MSTPSNQLDDVTVTSASLAPKGSPGTVQFGRKFSLIVADSTGQGVELGAFRCVFHIQRGDSQTPNSCNVRVYNLTRDTANSFAGKNSEFVQLAIQAGYPGNYGLLFRGSIVQARIGRESSTDSYIDFTAADGDAAYNFSALSLSLAAGLNAPRNSVQLMLKAMAEYGLSMDDTGINADALTGVSALPRGRVFHGLTRDALRTVAAESNCLWSIQDGALIVQPITEPVAGAEVLVSPETGLIGTPEQTQGGINITMLLNPYIKIGQAIRLGSSVTVNEYGYGLSLEETKNRAAIQMQNQLSGSGLYYTMRADHEGDTRENSWYTSVVALSIDATIFKLNDTSTFPSPAIPPRI